MERIIEVSGSPIPRFSDSVFEVGKYKRNLSLE